MSYSQPPPSYAPSAPKGYSAIPQEDAPTGSGPSAAAFDPTAPRTEGDAESDDFKYGVTVSQCDQEIRQQFLKKVSFEL